VRYIQQNNRRSIGKNQECETVYEHGEIKLTGIPGAGGFIRIKTQDGLSVAIETKDAPELAARLVRMAAVMQQ
jgi:hypothetical protein